MSHNSTRRDFLQTCAGALAAGAASRLGPLAAPAKARVVIARDAALRGSGATPDSARLLKLLDRGLQTLYDRDTALEAWRQLVRPNEVVGLKVNCLGGRGLSTTVTLVEAISERLQQAGIRDIVVWDRSERDLEAGGFYPRQRRGPVRCIGNDEAGFENDLSVYGSVGSRLSRTLTRTCDAVINLPVLKDHGLTGFTGALKNFYGAVHNPNKYHPNGGDPYIADLHMLPQIRAKMRLTINDGTTAQYEGGPGYKPQWTWHYNGLVLGRDAVALDYVGWQIIDAKRAQQRLKSLAADGREPRYIATAADPRHRLGTDDPALIERLEV